MDGSRRTQAVFLAVSLVVLSTPAAPVLASGPSMQRIVGTVGFSTGPDGKKTDVVTVSGVPSGAVAYSGCSSLAMLSLDDGAALTLGGRTNLVTPASGGSTATLQSGAMHYELDGRPATPLSVATQFGTVQISHGSGWIVAGDAGVQTIVRDGGPNDVTVTMNSTSTTVPGGQSAFSDANATKLAPIGTVNNPALNQFNDGRNPLGTDRTALYQDLTNSPAPVCAAGAVAAGAGAGALALIGLGAAGAIAIAAGGHGSSDTTPTPFTTPTPGTATSTPTATGTATATATASGSGLGTATPTPAPTATGTGGTTGALGPVVLNPSEMVLSPGIGSPATSTFTATQANYGGAFTVSQPSCPVGLFGSPTASVAGHTITVSLPSQVAALDLLCTMVVTGGGGMTATEPITISISALGTLLPTPTPGAGALGPVVPNPTSILLNPGIGSSASQTIAVTQTGYSGPFTAVLNGCLGIGAPPTISVTGSSVTVSLPAQTVALDLGCNAVITGGGGMSATVPITISVAAVGTPTAAPTSSGSAGAGPLTASPSTILLNPGVGSPATQNIIISPASEGPFAAITSCDIQLGAPPIESITGNVITITAPAQTITAPVGCSTQVVSGTTGNSVTIPITISATALGGAVPTPSPNPGRTGPLYTIPSSISVDPGITTEAIQNIEIFDPGFTGTYTVGIASGCLAIQQPVAQLVDGYIAQVSVPGQLLNVALLCNVTISDGTQSVQVPITIAATVLGTNAKKPVLDGIAFRPATLSLDRDGTSAGVDVIGTHAPYSASASCPAGAALEAQMQGTHATIRATASQRDAVCMVTITGTAGTFGQIPVRVKGSVLRIGSPELPARFGAGSVASPSAIVMNAGEERLVPLAGMGPFTLSGNCARIADTRLQDTNVHVTGRAAGTCSVTARSLSGNETTTSIVVRGDAGERPIHRM